MARLGGPNQFDLSDLGEDVLGGAPEVDDLEHVLDVAAEVLVDYGPDPGSTRIERLARYVSLNLGGDGISVVTLGAISRVEYSHQVVTEDGVEGETHVKDQVARVGAHVLVPRLPIRFTADGARSLAVALLRAAELADAEG